MKSKGLSFFFRCFILLGTALGIAYFADAPKKEYSVQAALLESRRAQLSRKLSNIDFGLISQKESIESPNSLEGQEKSLLVTHERNKAYPGFTLYPQNGTTKIFLLNMGGQVVHSWNIDATRARLLPNCNLLVSHGTRSEEIIEDEEDENGDNLRKKIREYSWDGSVVWEYEADDVAHHDLQRLSNGNTLILQRINVPKELKASIRDVAYQNSRIRTDSILEVNPEGSIVWNWRLYEHFDINRCGKRACEELKKGITRPKIIDWTHTNTVAPIPPNKWFDGGDTRFRPGNLVILPRNWSEVFIIDKETGSPVWEYSGSYKGGIVGGHEAHMIEPGLRGEGNILIFDNRRKQDASAILEINPVTKEIVWLYDVGPQFYSAAAGSVQRLPNGNTLISEDIPGRIFEVTPDKQRVWEFHGGRRGCRAKRYESNYCPKLKELELGV